MRTIKLLFAAGLLAALLVPATGASADVHETVGGLHTECVVDGSVSVNVDPNPSNNSYNFVDSTLECVGTYTDVFDVSASGDTTDYFHDTANSVIAGEDCDQAGSARDIDEVHTGTLSAFGSSVDFDGHVHFVRLGTEVLADGPLSGTDGTDHFFQAELTFVPTSGTCTKDDPITSAALTGIAEIYRPVVEHVCNTDSDKLNDPHCTS